MLAMASGMPACAETILEPVAFAALDGWTSDDHGAALAAFRRSCGEIVAGARAFERPVRFGGRREQWLGVQ